MPEIGENEDDDDDDDDDERPAALGRFLPLLRPLRFPLPRRRPLVRPLCFRFPPRPFRRRLPLSFPAARCPREAVRPLRDGGDADEIN